MKYTVSYKARGLSTNWIAQSIDVDASDALNACSKAEQVLTRQCRIGAWFVDYFLTQVNLSVESEERKFNRAFDNYVDELFNNPVNNVEDKMFERESRRMDDLDDGFIWDDDH